jgi:hypothetical protein
MQGRREHNYLVNAGRGSKICSTRVFARCVRGYADGWGGGSRKIFKCGSMFAYTSITFKKKWKPALRETLSDGEKLTFEPTERNRRVIADIREANTKVRNKRERERDVLQI